MIKIRNKRIALLLVLAMLATMFVGVGTASASNNIDVTSGWNYVESGEDDQPTSDIVVAYNDDSVYTQNVTVVVTLTTAGVAFSSTGTADKTFANQTMDATINAGDIDVDDDVTGSISADVRVYYKSGTTYYFDETESTVIAKVDSGATTITVAKKANVAVGDDQKGSAITVKETGPTGFDDAEEVTFTCATTGVEFETYAANDDPVDGNFTASSTITGLTADRETDKKIVVDFNTSDVQAEKVVFTPYFVIAPSVKVGTEVKVKVTGDNITSTTVVVGVVGSSDVVVTVSDADKDFIYRGQAATFDDVTVKLNPGGKLDTEVNDNDWFSVTLPAGVKFQNAGAITVDGTVDLEGFYDNDRTAWFDVEADTDDTIKLTDFALVADANAVVGDLKIKLDGAATGEYKIGTINNAYTVTTTPFALTTGMTGVTAANIVIKETADGALKESADGYEDMDGDDQEYGFFDLTLPAGVTFVGTPTIEVTEGDLEIDEDSLYIGEDFRDLFFEITGDSIDLSTITISGLEYTVLSQPGVGDLKALTAQDYNIASDKALESVIVGAVATNPTAVYVIGAATFTVNGASNSVVAPSYVKNDRTYLAIRDIATGLGINPMNVMWDEANQKVTMIKGDKIVQVAIGSKTMYVNGTAIAMDVAPEMGPTFRTMLPAAFIAQAFGATASWDGATSTVTIK